MLRIGLDDENEHKTCICNFQNLIELVVLIFDMYCEQSVFEWIDLSMLLMVDTTSLLVLM